MSANRKPMSTNHKKNHENFYIDGAWVSPAVPKTLDVIDPATRTCLHEDFAGQRRRRRSRGGRREGGVPAFSRTTRDERLALLRKVLELLQRALQRNRGRGDRRDGRADEVRARGAGVGRQVHLEATIKALEELEFSYQRGNTRIVRESIGVVGLITPWNWPLNQIVCKVAPAIAAGCTMVLKPSEIAPISGIIFAEIMHDAEVPKGVFNLVNGDGPTVGQYLSGHPDVAMMSFTGSTRAGIIVAKVAAETVKRVAQELGGKSRQHHIGGCGPQRCRDTRCGRLLQQQRTVVRRAHPDVRAGGPSSGSSRNRQRRRRHAHRRRSARARKRCWVRS